jgi:hypothetical protein
VAVASGCAPMERERGKVVSITRGVGEKCPGVGSSGARPFANRYPALYVGMMGT